MDKVLVTGGAGFIGSHVVGQLVEAGAGVRVLDNLSTGCLKNIEPFEAGLEFIEADVRDAKAMRAAVAGVTRVIHLAAEISVPKSLEDPARTYDVNVAGTLNVLEEARQAGAECCVIASSAAVYGEAPSLPQSESSVTRPLSPYGLSKLACERLGELYASGLGLPTVSLRLFNVYGPRQRHDSPYAAVIPIFVTRMAQGRAPVVFGDGRQRRDFVYVGDVARALIAASHRADLGGQVLNIASGSTVDLLQLIDAINATMGTDLEPVFEKERDGDISHSAADTSRARRGLGFESQVPLSEGLALMARHVGRARAVTR